MLHCVSLNFFLTWMSAFKGFSLLMLIKLGRQLLFIRATRLYSSSETLNPAKMSAGEAFTGVPISRVVTILEKFAPNQWAESWDNTGLLVEPYTPRNIKNILLTNDLTEDVAKEAKEKDCELIISYHPPIFTPMKSVIQSKWKERVISFLLENRIYLYSPHTCWDAAEGGVNDWLASAFSFSECRPILPKDNPKIGSGRILTLKKKLSIAEAIAEMKKRTGVKHVRFAMGRGKTMNDPVNTVALCAGSGGSVLKDVLADLYVTGEMLHHDVLDAAQKGTSVILTNHSDSERGYLEVVAILLRTNLGLEYGVSTSACDKDPLVTV